MRFLFSAVITLFLISASAHTLAANSLYDLTYKDFKNKDTDLTAYKGKVVFLNFWATWCAPCVKEMPSMQALKAHFTDAPFEIVAVNMGESPEVINKFLADLGTTLTFPIVLDEEGKSYGELGLRGLPMTLIYDHNGNKITQVLGGKDWDSDEAIDTLNRFIYPPQ